VIDFKTGKSEDDDFFQLRFYKLLAEKNFAKSVSKASFYYLRSGRKRELDLAETDPKQVEDEVTTKIDTICQEEDFSPKPGRLCRFCMFKSFCPAKKEVKNLTETDQKEAFADDLPF
jgi:putative RecB family exonuclease